MRKLLAIACAVLVLVACRTVSIIPRRPIEVPSSLSASQVEIALFSAISEKPVAKILAKSLEPGTDNERSIRLFAFSDQDQSRVGWFPDLIEPGRIITTYRRRTRHLQVGIQYTKFEVTTEILDSQNLKQRNGRIHERALILLSDLEFRIRQSLQTIDVLTP